MNFFFLAGIVCSLSSIRFLHAFIHFICWPYLFLTVVKSASFFFVSVCDSLLYAFETGAKGVNLTNIMLIMGACVEVSAFNQPKISWRL